VRGDVFELPSPRNASGHEQRGARFCVIVQAASLPLSTVIVCPTSASALPAQWRPEVVVRGKETRVLTEQMTAVNPERLGRQVGTLSLAEMFEVDRALRLILDLR
jgi:mRNA interferase MazF